jgi:hypothetical protein
VSDCTLLRTYVCMQVLGKLGSVVQLYPDGDLKVKIGDTVLKFNAKCCSLVPHGQQDMNNTFVADGDGSVLDHPSNCFVCYSVKLALECILLGSGYPVDFERLFLYVTIK